MTKYVAEVVVVEHPPGIVSRCSCCRKILSSGIWAVGIHVGPYKYLVGVNPPVTCCDELRQVIATFEKERDAESLAVLVVDLLRQDGSTKNLVLYDALFVVTHDDLHAEPTTLQ